MSALDRAYIRAYARGSASQAPAADDMTGEAPIASTLRTLPAPAAAANSAELESMYAEGSFYRIDLQPEQVATPARQRQALNRRQLRFAAPNVAAAKAPASRPTTKPVHKFREPLTVVAARLREMAEPIASIVAEQDDPIEIVPQPAQPALETAEPTQQPREDAVPPPVLSPQIEFTVRNWDERAGFSTVNVVHDSLPALLAQAPQSVTAGGMTPSLPAAREEAKDYELAGPAEAAPKPLTPPIEESILRLDAARVTTPKPHFGRKPAEAPAKPAAEPEVVNEEPVPVEVASPAKVEPQAVVEAPLVPVWEVDNFQWPPICDRLLSGEQSHFAQAGEKLKTAIKDGLRVLGIAATKRGDGSTTLALCLARSAAKAGLNVAIIDADLARPELADSLGIEVECGWQAAAAGKVPLAEAAIKSLHDGITVFPLKPQDGSVALADARSGEMIRSIAKHYDLVLVDLGNATSTPGPLLPQTAPSPIDAAVVVRDARTVTESSARIVGLKLHAAGIEAVGLAENFGQLTS